MASYFLSQVTQNCEQEGVTTHRFKCIENNFKGKWLNAYFMYAPIDPDDREKTRYSYQKKTHTKLDQKDKTLKPSWTCINGLTYRIIWFN